MMEQVIKELYTQCNEQVQSGNPLTTTKSLIDSMGGHPSFDPSTRNVTQYKYSEASDQTPACQSLYFDCRDERVSNMKDSTIPEQEIKAKYDEIKTKTS